MSEENEEFVKIKKSELNRVLDAYRLEAVKTTSTRVLQSLTSWLSDMDNEEFSKADILELLSEFEEGAIWAVDWIKDTGKSPIDNQPIKESNDG
jgi:hypothetical protein